MSPLHRSPGHAALGILKLLGVTAGGMLVTVPVMRYAFQQAEASGSQTLWLAIAALVPILIGIFGWMVRDSGNLRELTGRFNDHKDQASKKVDKIDDAQERIFRELGAAGEFRKSLTQQLEQINDDRSVQSKLRHDMRGEWTALLGASDLAHADKFDKLDERLRALEQALARQEGAA